jgi:hypothetical protein
MGKNGREVRRGEKGGKREEEIIFKSYWSPFCFDSSESVLRSMSD